MSALVGTCYQTCRLEGNPNDIRGNVYHRVVRFSNLEAGNKLNLMHVPKRIRMDLEDNGG